jgi:hypothetical protein
LAIRLRSHYSHISLDIPPIVQLWLLRLLVPLGGHRDFVNQCGFSNDMLDQVLGFGDWVDPESRDFEPKSVRSELRKLHQTGERKLHNAATAAYLSTNVMRLSDLSRVSTG